VGVGVGVGVGKCLGRGVLGECFQVNAETQLLLNGSQAAKRLYLIPDMPFPIL